MEDHKKCGDDNENELTTNDDDRDADDIVLIATSLEDLKTLIRRLVEALQKYGISTNTRKPNSRQL